MTIFKKLLRGALRLAFRIVFRVRVDGALPGASGRPLLVVANHESFLDGMLLGLFLPIDPVFVINTDIARTPWLRPFLSLVDHLPVDPTNPLAIRRVVKLLESGRPVVIFPEGRITTTGALMKVYDGPAFAASRTGARILPVRIDGAARTHFSRVTGRYPKSLMPQLSLSILPTTQIPELRAVTAKSRRKEAGEHLRRVMQHMMFASTPRHSLPDAFLDAAQIYGLKSPCLEDMVPRPRSGYLELLMKAVGLGKRVPAPATTGRYSYGDLLKMTLGLSRLTGRIGKEWETVGVLLPNLATTIGLMLGLQVSRRFPAMLNFTAGAEGLRAACHTAEIRTVITSRSFVAKSGLADTLTALTASGEVEVRYLEDLRQELGLFDKLWLVAFALRFPRLALPQLDPEQPAVILFTSGTEGKPKGVVLSHRALLANIAQVRAVIDVTANDKVMNVLPVFHSFGLTGGALLPLLSGAEVVLYPSPLHYKVIPELIYDRNCTVLYGTSTFLGGYAKHAHPVDFHKLRYVIAGAEKLSDAVRETWIDKFGIRILEGYGATETAPVLAVNTRHAYRGGSVGQLLPDILAKVVPVPGIERGGMLHVNGPNLMSGYLRYDNPGQLERPESEAGVGWYNTGDVVEIDADGFVFILGRVKRFAKVAGEMVSLEVVERLATAASPDGPHAAVAIADEKRGEAIVLVTVDATLTRERLQQAARDTGLPEIAVPRTILVRESLPLLGTGKLDYVALKRLAEAQ